MRKNIIGIRISPTNVIKEKIKVLERKNGKIIRLDTIETNLDTPQNIKNVTIKAIRDGITKYTTYSGIYKLKEAVCIMLRKKYNLKYEPAKNCLISCGSKHALFNCIFSQLNIGDEVIIFAPYWETYIEQVKISGGIPRIIETQEENNFEPTEKELSAVINKKTKIIIINSPSNPTGTVYSRKTLEIIARVAKRKSLIILSDETMADFTYGDCTHIPIASISRDTYKRTFTIGSVSKNYSMSGYRIGFVCGNIDVTRTMSILQAQITANPVSFSQFAAIEAWTGNQESLINTVNEFEERKLILENGLKQIQGIEHISGQGAVFLFPNISSILGKDIAGKHVKNSQDFCDLLLKKGVAIVPGNYFGNQYFQNIRVSYSCATKKEIGQAVRIIKNLLL